jgi:hypothetical protein
LRNRRIGRDLLLNFRVHASRNSAAGRSSRRRPKRALVLLRINGRDFLDRRLAGLGNLPDAHLFQLSDGRHKHVANLRVVEIDRSRGIDTELTGHRRACAPSWSFGMP